MQIFTLMFVAANRMTFIFIRFFILVVFLSKAFHVCLHNQNVIPDGFCCSDDDEVWFDLLIFYEAVMDGFGIIESRS